MLFKLHYFLMAAGFSAMGILLGVYLEEYTDATNTEIGLVYMLMPFVGMICKPIVSSLADSNQAHRTYLMACLMLISISYLPFVLVPWLGPAVYKHHARLCFYFLLTFKVIGDVSYGCAATIGDSLAVNYCKRIGNELCYYRIGGTISWTIFGLIVGSLNETWFLPKYVAGFMILIATSLLNMFSLYLWPSAYFVMLTSSELEVLEIEATSSPWTRSLMPRDEVWSHAKSKLRALASFSFLCPSETSHQFDGVAKHKLDEPIRTTSDRTHRRAQLLALLMLLKRDLRIAGYLLVFVAGGAAVMSLSFFLMSLSETCNTNDRCNFSHLAGLLQVSISISETIWIIYMDRVVRAIGRVNTLSLAFALFASKNLFYGTLWPDVSPYYSILLETQSGVTHGILFILMNELGHLFATQVEHLTPELIDRGLIEPAGHNLSLSATMQALFASAYDGLGRGVAALAYGYIVDRYSFETLWLVVSCISLSALIGLQTINLIDYFFHFEHGLKAAESDTINRLGECEAQTRVGRRMSVQLIE